MIRWLQCHGSGIQELYAESDEPAIHVNNTGISVLSQLPHLKTLELNNLSSAFLRHGQLSCLQSLTRLQALVIGLPYRYASDPYQPSGEVLDPLTRLTGLQSLTLQVPEQQASLPTALTNLMRLTKLSLVFEEEWRDADASHTAAEIVGQLIALRHLSSSAALPGVPACFANLTALEMLQLANCGSDSSFGNLGCLAQCPLTHLSIRAIPTDWHANLALVLGPLTRLRSLKRLDLSKQGFPHQLEEIWSFSPNLTRLDLDCCSLETIPTALANLTCLRRLSMQGNHIHDLIPGPYLLCLEILVMAICQSQKPPIALLEAPALQEVAFRPLNLKILDGEWEVPWDVDAFVVQMARHNPSCQVCFGKDDDDDELFKV